MKSSRRIELLAPARNLESGMAAVDHGADAVYIGAPRFGARAAAGNSLEDITRLTAYAHIFNARVYVTLNTILYEEELEEAEKMIWALYRAGVDALIIQDMGITRLNLPPIPLHASTQTDNRTSEKVKFLADTGFHRVILARELSIDQIADIHSSTGVELEVFVHGALCVSYSGQCYVSQACYGRSANRGECAQFCRLPFTMTDADGKIIAREKHLLSLKDLNRLDELENLLDAGVTSFKIEGRLKDITYVKNITAAYRGQLDGIMKRRPEFIRASSGKSRYTFKPQPDKSFSRGFTSYFLNGRTADIYSFDTPKSLGEEMGRVKEVRKGCITVAGIKSFNNGDGVCFIDHAGKLQGFRVNRVDGNKLYPQAMPVISKGVRLYRNLDQEFEKVLSKPSAERKIVVSIELGENNFGFSLTVADEDDNQITITLPLAKEHARTPQSENIRNQLSKLGNTPFEATKVDINLSENWFLPASVLADLRRQAVDKLLMTRRINYRKVIATLKKTDHPFPHQSLTYLGNVSNSLSKAFYLNHKAIPAEPAFELQTPENAVLMFTKHCLRYSMGWCPVHQKEKSPYQEPFFLTTSDGKRFRIQFDCKNCQMKIFQA